MKQTLSAPERLPVEAIIQCAMDMEAAPLLDALQPLPGEDAPRSLLLGAPGNHAQAFTLGLIDGRRVLVATSGIGLANAASATARALVLVDAPLVIAAGTTGGLARGINVGDIALGLAAIYGQADATAFGYAPGQVPQMPVDYRTSDGLVRLLDGLAGALAHPVLRGRILSSDSFVTAPIAEPMRERFPDAIGADMETCAMAQVAWSAGVDWVSLRAVSDLCGPAAGQDFHMDSEEAARRSADAVRMLLALLGTSSSEKARQAEGDSNSGGRSLGGLLRAGEGPVMSTSRQAAPDGPAGKAVAEPLRVLMVCTGNICRSTMAHQILAESVAAEGLSGRILVDSAGISDEEEGNPIDPRAARVLREAGHSLPDHRARQLRAAELGRWDLVLAMTSGHYSALHRLASRSGADAATLPSIEMFRDYDPEAGSGDRDLPDPWYGGHRDFLDTLEVIERTTPVLMEHLKTLLR